MSHLKYSQNPADLQSGENRETVGYFGFGSLVNHHTLRTEYVDVIPATLSGWRRHWQGRDLGENTHIALLSVHETPDCALKGMIVIDSRENLPLVDEREEGYSRVRLERDAICVKDNPNLPQEIYIYVANPVPEPPQKSALLQSYLDAVMQGYLLHFGEAGVEHFMDTTDDFQRSLIRDRHAPLYPRSVTLSKAEEELFDAQLRRIGIEV